MFFISETRVHKQREHHKYSKCLFKIDTLGLGQKAQWLLYKNPFVRFEGKAVFKNGDSFQEQKYKAVGVLIRGFRTWKTLACPKATKRQFNSSIGLSCSLFGRICKRFKSTAVNSPTQQLGTRRFLQGVILSLSLIASE